MDTNKETLAFFEQIYANGKTTTTKSTITVKPAQKQKQFELPLSVDKLFEVYGNLVMAGFTEDEALIIVVGVITQLKNE